MSRRSRHRATSQISDDTSAVADEAVVEDADGSVGDGIELPQVQPPRARLLRLVERKLLLGLGTSLGVGFVLSAWFRR